MSSIKQALVYVLLASFLTACAESNIDQNNSNTAAKTVAELPADSSSIDKSLLVVDRNYYAAFTAITVGVADLNVALELWVDHFGMNIVSSREGSDPELERVWGLEPGDVSRQALLRTNSSPTGMIHFVEFNNPDEPVRKGAENFDLTPKNLDLYVKDLPAMIEELRASGAVFRTDTYSEFTSVEGIIFREIQMPSHDNINVVLLEIVGEEHNYSDKGVAAIGPFVFIVPDVEVESAFFQSLFLLDKLNENIFSGPEIEKIVGLPKGTALKILIWGREGFEMGELEIIEYQGVEGNNLYPRAKPKALGVLHIGYVVPDASLLKERLKTQNVPFTSYGETSTMIGEGEMISFMSPAGMRIEVYGR